MHLDAHPGLHQATQRVMLPARQGFSDYIGKPASYLQVCKAVIQYHTTGALIDYYILTTPWLIDQFNNWPNA